MLEVDVRVMCWRFQRQNIKDFKIKSSLVTKYISSKNKLCYRIKAMNTTQQSLSIVSISINSARRYTLVLELTLKHRG